MPQQEFLHPMKISIGSNPRKVDFVPNDNFDLGLKTAQPLENQNAVFSAQSRGNNTSVFPRSSPEKLHFPRGSPDKNSIFHVAVPKKTTFCVSSS